MDWIDNIVIGLIEDYRTNDIYELCSALDIKIVKLNSENILLRGKAAFYYRNVNKEEIIFIRNDLAPTLEQFILKHELGHALCHPDMLYAGYSNIGKLEKQANYFAFKLSNINIDKTELEGLTLKQISNYISIPYKILNKLLND